MNIQIIAKCSDCCNVKVPDLDLEKQGYVPRDLGIGGGDYIQLVINNETGKIDGWIPFSPEELTDVLS